MSDTAERHRRLAAAMTRTVEGVPADRWDSPSPCEGWTARQVVEHVADHPATFLGLVGLPAPEPADDAATRWADARDALQTALDDPSLAQRPFEGFDGPSTLEQAVERFVCLDLVVHRWDVARATGQDERIDPDDVAWAHAQAASFGPMLRAEGVCGPEVEVPADADAQTRMLAFGGRRP